MRIIGGALGGRRLLAPPGMTTRPTADRVRQALFNILGGRSLGQPGRLPADAGVLDLFAGSGALGLEALSRGAARAVFVEEDPGALRVLRDNLHDLDLLSRAQVLPLSIDRAMDRLLSRKDATFPMAVSFIFADPPYREGRLPALLSRLGAPGCPLLSDDTVVVVEHARVKGLPGPGPEYGALLRDDERCYGQTALSFYARSVTSADG